MLLLLRTLSGGAIVAAVYGAPVFTRWVASPARRVGTMRDKDNSARMGGVPVTDVSRRIGSEPK